MTKSAQPDALVYGAFLAVLVWAPLPLASNRTWGWVLLSGLVGLVFLGWLVTCLRRGPQLSSAVWRAGRWPLALLAAVQAWVWFQGIPLPREVVALLSPLAAHWQPEAATIPLSLDTANTHLYLLRGLAFTQAFLLTLALVNSTHRLRILLITLVISGTAQALYGAFMVLSGLELGFFVEKYIGRGVATGTFVNRNHYAGYLVMRLAAGTGLLLEQLNKTRSSDHWRDWVRQGLSFVLSPAFILRAGLAAMVVALVLTRSRMGNFAFFFALGVTGVMAQWAARRFSWRISALIGSLFLIDVLIISRWFGLDELVQRLQAGPPAEGGRVELWPAAIEYVQQFLLTGSGGGSFYGVITNFMPQDTEANPNNAHSDYLEFAAELGVIATLVLGAVIALAMGHAWQALRQRRTPLLRATGFVTMMTAIWALTHSLVDFSLQVPANALTFCVILALGCVAARLPSDRRTRVRSRHVSPEL